MEIKVLKTHINAKFELATEGAGGFDLATTEALFEPVSKLVSTGVIVAIPEGYAGLLLPRSSLHKKNWTLSNSVGLIDSDYRGEIKLSLVPRRAGRVEPLLPGDRVVQLVVVPILTTYRIVDTMDIEQTERGSGGFGSTGK